MNRLMIRETPYLRLHLGSDGRVLRGRRPHPRRAKPDGRKHGSRYKRMGKRLY